MALMLVSGTGLLLRSFVNLLNVDTGFTPRQRDGDADVRVGSQPGPGGAAQLPRSRDGEGRVAFPASQQVGAVQAMPFIESNIDIQGQMRLVDQPPPQPGEEIRASYNVASPDYFAVMGVRPLKGRLLDDRDGPTRRGSWWSAKRSPSAICASIDPIGQRLEIRAQGKPVADARSSAWCRRCGTSGSIRRRAPKCCSPFAQSPTGSMTLVARTSVDPATLIETTKREIWTIDPLQTFYRTATLEELVDRTLITRRFALIVLTGFAALALLLAAAGLYGVLSTIASQYRQGDRRAHGARRRVARHPAARRDARPGGVGDRRRRRAGRRARRRAGCCADSCSA